eukprot:TRINITY_DN24691_c0_g1_i1.p1 TRINITY_DN24691_c0_g1~~TRINITY_DN24691_c0_g1_i1.p1  ORF type:complete len:683 (-),score=82.15 TRINITY_DN24691_c0_g1_i1:548-2596(-)
MGCTHSRSVAPLPSAPSCPVTDGGAWTDPAPRTTTATTKYEQRYSAPVAVTPRNEELTPDEPASLPSMVVEPPSVIPVRPQERQLDTAKPEFCDLRLEPPSEPAPQVPAIPNEDDAIYASRVQPLEPEEVIERERSRRYREQKRRRSQRRESAASSGPSVSHAEPTGEDYFPPGSWQYELAVRILQFKEQQREALKRGEQPPPISAVVSQPGTPLTSARNSLSVSFADSHSHSVATTAATSLLQPGSQLSAGLVTQTAGMDASMLPFLLPEPWTAVESFREERATHNAPQRPITPCTTRPVARPAGRTLLGVQSRGSGGLNGSGKIEQLSGESGSEDGDIVDLPLPEFLQSHVLANLAEPPADGIPVRLSQDEGVPAITIADVESFVPPSETHGFCCRAEALCFPEIQTATFVCCRLVPTKEAEAQREPKRSEPPPQVAPAATLEAAVPAHTFVAGSLVETPVVQVAPFEPPDFRLDLTMASEELEPLISTQAAAVDPGSCPVVPADNSACAVECPVSEAGVFLDCTEAILAPEPTPFEQLPPTVHQEARSPQPSAAIASEPQLERDPPVAETAKPDLAMHPTHSGPSLPHVEEMPQETNPSLQMESQLADLLKDVASTQAASVNLTGAPDNSKRRHRQRVHPRDSAKVDLVQVADLQRQILQALHRPPAVKAEKTTLPLDT